MTRPVAGACYASPGHSRVVAILGFLVLPAIVVMHGRVQRQAILSFPPETWSWRWFAKAIDLRGFPGRLPQRADRHGVGLDASRWSSAPAFAFALDRYQFRVKRAIETVLLRPGDPAFHGRAGLSDHRRAARRGADFLGGRRLPCRAGAAVRAAQRLRLAPQPRQRLELAAASLGASPASVLLTVTLPLLAPGLVGGWLFAAILSFNEFTASLFVTGPAHANAAGRHVQLRARVCRSLDGGPLRHLSSSSTAALLTSRMPSSGLERC